MLTLQDCLGTWHAEATIPGGGSYRGVIDVAEHSQGLRFDWRISDGEYVGLGALVDDALYVACGESLDGLLLVFVDRDERRVRWWDADGDPHAMPLAAGDDDGFSVEGAGLGWRRAAWRGTDTVRAVSLDGRPDAALVWRTPRGHVLACGPDFRQLAFLRYVAGERPGTLQARWALGGRDGLADETMTRVS